MRGISSQQTELIIDALAEGKTRLPPAILEKDILLTEVISEISTIRSKNFSLHFCGGTSLAKCFDISNRMSEDLDFKVVMISQETGNSQRKILGALRDEIVKKLLTLDYGVDVRSDNRNSHFVIKLNYKSQFDPSASLRPEILLEFTLDQLTNPSSDLKVKTLIYEAVQQTSSNPRISVVSLQQTTAEKILTFLRERNPIQPESGRDARLIRHIYDVARIMASIKDISDLAHCFNLAIRRDLLRFSELNGFARDPNEFLRTSTFSIINDELLKGEYSNFISELTVTDDFTFEEDLKTFIDLARTLINQLP